MNKMTFAEIEAELARLEEDLREDPMFEYLDDPYVQQVQADIISRIIELENMLPVMEMTP